jgi:proteic killer suppression protein
VIRSFRSKGLAEFARTGSTRRLSVRNADRVRRVLSALDAATAPDDLNLPGFHFHALAGDRSGLCSVRVTANWRITFEWDGTDVINVDLEDYH